MGRSYTKLAHEHPLPIKSRMSVLFIEKTQIDVINGVWVALDSNGVRTQIPLGSVVCIMLEPGTRISHEAVKIAAKMGTLLVWVGEAGVRLYSAGQPGGARSDRLLYQAKLALNADLRLRVVGRMFQVRFGEEAPKRRSVDQLRGLEGVRVKQRYRELAQMHGIEWNGRSYDRLDWNKADAPNRCLSAATACLYGVTEAAVIAAGYAPSIGFIHSGKPLSFVYDIADLFKFETVVPAAFESVANNRCSASDVRRACRDKFRETRMLKRIIPMIEDVLAASNSEAPKAFDDSQPPAFLDDKTQCDPGFR